MSSNAKSRLAQSFLKNAGDPYTKTEFQSILDSISPSKENLRDLVQCRNAENKNALHVTSEMGCAGQLQALLKVLHSSDLINETIDSECDGGYTPLHLAAKTAQSTCVKLLLDHGANPFKKTQYGKTPLEVAKSNSNFWSTNECISILEAIESYREGSNFTPKPMESKLTTDSPPAPPSLNIFSLLLCRCFTHSDPLSSALMDETSD